MSIRFAHPASAVSHAGPHAWGRLVGEARAELEVPRVNQRSEETTQRSAEGPRLGLEAVEWGLWEGQADWLATWRAMWSGLERGGCGRGYETAGVTSKPGTVQLPCTQQERFCFERSGKGLGFPSGGGSPHGPI